MKFQTFNNEYENAVDALSDDGYFSQDELNSIMNKAVANIREKAWDADVEATKILS